MWRWLALLALLPGPVSLAREVPIDTQNSVIGFEIRTRYGQRLTGRFPVFQGQVQTLEDGRETFSLTIDARFAEVIGYKRYTNWLRGEDFFDVQRHPLIHFHSQPQLPGIASSGGEAHGELTLRGIRGPIRMQVAPAQCGAPGYDCPVVGRGTVSRAAYGMDGWQLAVGDRVTFVLQIRLNGGNPS